MDNGLIALPGSIESVITSIFSEFALISGDLCGDTRFKPIALFL